ncbi:MAG: ring-cleaving dioxygenase, partial [Vagococcus lutrae]|nr:ring-cleaving dioxygenase [Vagococcus lutrae]
ALGIDNIASLNRLKRELSDRAIVQSEIKEREFFTSIYLRDPNQILFEVATPPTLNYQEKNNVGVKWSEQALVLPEFLENQRRAIEKKLKEQEG